MNRSFLKGNINSSLRISSQQAKGKNKDNSLECRKQIIKQHLKKRLNSGSQNREQQPTIQDTNGSLLRKANQNLMIQ